MTEPRQSRRFLYLYALAWAGGAAGYIPLLTVILPARVTGLAGDAATDWLAYIAFAGAIAASVGAILAGMASDALRNRRWPALAGLAAYVALTPLFALPTSLAGFLLLIVPWQLALNLVLAPLAAWAGDCVPDRQKGLLGGLLAFAPATGAIAGALVTMRGLAGFEMRLWMVAGVVAAAVLPVVLCGRPVTVPDLMVADPAPKLPREKRVRIARMWLARLAVQIAEATLFAFLYVWLTGLEPGFDDADVARLFMAMLVLGVPASLLVGRWSDRADEPILPLRVAAVVAAIGLAAMALAGTMTQALAGYAVFILSTSVFLALHSAQILRVLPRPDHRGRDLGYFNLTNTVPSLVMPWLVVALVPSLGFTGLFWVLAGLSALAPMLLPRR